MVEGGFAWWCESDKESIFASIVSEFAINDLICFCRCGFSNLENYYSVKSSFSIITKGFNI